MKDVLKKLTKNKTVLIGGGIAIIIIIIMLAIILLSNSPNKTMKKYCKALVKGRYGDVLDITYFPESDLITKDKIEEAKKDFIERVQKEEEDNIVSCKYTKLDEDEDIISYKLIINKEKTGLIEIDKKTNKIILEGIYKEVKINTYKGSTITVDNKDISKYKTSSKEGIDYYNIIVLSDANYNVKTTNPMLKDSEFERKLSTTENLSSSTNISESSFKEDYYEDLKNNVTAMFENIAKTSYEKEDISELNKYFVNNNANEFIDINKIKEYLAEKESGSFIYTFKEWGDISINNDMQYVDIDSIKTNIYVPFKQTQARPDGSSFILFTYRRRD